MARKIASIALGNLLSKALAVGREVLFAAWFGTSDTAAAFRVAQTAYLLPTQALIGDSLSAGLLPLYKRLGAEEQNKARALVLVAAAYGLMFSLTVTAVLYSYSYAVAAFIAPGANHVVLVLAGKLIRILALATPFYVLGGMLSYVEAAFDRYAAIAWRPLLLNVGSILGAALAVYTGKEHWLASVLVFTHIVFLAWTVLSLRRLDRLTPSSAPERGVLRHISKMFLLNMAPLLGLPLVAQINVLVERVVSSHISASVIPSVDYARFLSDTMVQLIAVPLGVLTLSMHGGSSSNAARKQMETVAVSLILVAFPIGLFLSQQSPEIVRLLFARGAFGPESVAMTAAILGWMGGALGATITAYYLVKSLNAQLRNLEALAATFIACAVNVAVNVLLWKQMGPPTIGMAVAAYSFTLFVICAHLLKLWRILLPTLAWVVLGCCSQYLICHLFSATLPYPFNLGLAGALSAILWIGLISFVPPLRQVGLPLARKLPLISGILKKAGL